MLLRLLMLIFNSAVANNIYALMVKRNQNNWSNVVGGKMLAAKKATLF